MKSWWPVAVVAAIGLAATGLSFLLVSRADERHVQAALELRAEWRARDFQRKIELAAGPVTAAAAFIASQPSMEAGSAEADELKRFATQAARGDSALRALGWAPRVTHEDRVWFEARVHVASSPEFRIFEQDQNGQAVPAAERADYYPALIHIPFERQGSIVGYDLGSEPNRRGAIELAVHTGSLAGSQPARLIVLSQVDPSYLVFAPVYEGGIVPATIEDRQRLLRGVAMGTFRVRAMLSAAMQGTPPVPEGIAFRLGRIVDEGDSGLTPPLALIAVYSPARGRIADAFSPDDAVADGAYRLLRSFDVRGQRWQLEFAFPTEIVARERSSGPLIALVAGLLLSTALSFYVARERARRVGVERVVEAQTAELSHANAALSTLIANLPMGVSLVGPDLRFMAFNEQFYEEFKLLRTLEVGDPFEKFMRFLVEHGIYGTGDPEGVLRERMELARNPVREQFETTRPDGRAADVRIVPLPGGGFVTTRIDITDRRRREIELDDARQGLERQAAELKQVNFDLRREVGKREEATSLLEAANAKLQALVDASPLPIVSLDTRCHVVTWNRAAERTFGYAAAEVLGRAYPLVPPDSQAEFEALFQRIKGGENLRDIGVSRRHKDGRVLAVTVSAAPLYNADRHLIGVVYVLEDVTEKKKLEQQVAQAVKMDAVGQLTGGIAHDFNNILGIIVGNLDQQIETLRSRAEVDAVANEAKDLGTEALDAALRGAELVKRLLAFSRSQPLQPRLLDLTEVIRDVEPLLWRALGENITVETRVRDRLWPVKADPTELENVLLNLAINARDAMPNGGSLTLSCANASLDADAAAASELPPADYVALSVMDTGTGIPPEVLARVFDPFFTTKEVGKGSGLGLSMVYGYARQSGGTVKIFSEVGQGTEVKVYLPRADAGSADVTVAAESDVPIEQGSERILLVEDKAEVRAMALRLLSSLGYQVIDADCAASALKLIDGGATIDLLFTDIVMPGAMSGIELAREVRRRFPRLPIVFTSGFSNPQTVHSEAIALGATLISKPYRKVALAEHLRTVFEQAVLHRSPPAAPAA